MKVLMTGGAGFIGSHLADRLLDRGHEVYVIDNLTTGTAGNLSQNVQLHQVDVRSSELAGVFTTINPDTVVHLAAQLDVRMSVRDPMQDADINILGTLNVLECARKVAVRKVIVASSGGCIYGPNSEPPFDEHAPGPPISPYGISKRVLHDYLDFYRDVYGLDSTVLALSNVYGPRQDSRGEAGVVAIFIEAMLNGASTVIFGDGAQTRDFVYVDDVVDAFLLAMARGEGVYNIGTGTETSVSQLWQTCAEIIGYRGTPEYRATRAGELQRNALNANRARDDLRWSPQVTLRAGLIATTRYIEQSMRSNTNAGDSTTLHL